MRERRRVTARAVLHDEINMDALVEAVLGILAERTATKVDPPTKPGQADQPDSAAGTSKP